MKCTKCNTELTEIDGMHYCENADCKRAFLPVEMLNFGAVSLFSPTNADKAALTSIKSQVIGYPVSQDPQVTPTEPLPVEAAKPVMPVPTYATLSAPDAWRLRLKGVCHYLASTHASEEQMVETLSRFLTEAYGEDVQ